MKKLIKEVKEFFESYEMENILFDREEIKVNIFEAKSRMVLQVNIIERCIKARHKRYFEPHSFCSVTVENNLIKITFKYKKARLSDDFLECLNKMKKSDYIVRVMGNQVTVAIKDPTISEISKLFLELESYCRKGVYK